MQGLIAVDGKVTPAQEAVIPALDRGALYGDAVLETLVAFGGKLLDAPRHLARLRASAETLGIGVPWSDAELAFELATLAESLPVAKAHVRLVVSRGAGLGLMPAAAAKPSRVAYCLPAGLETTGIYTSGLSLKRVLSGSQQRGAQPKTSGYLPAILALTKARGEGYDDILWTNADNEITEASAANLFLIARDGDEVVIVTPPAHSGLLLGITRERVIQLLRNAKLPVHEQTVYVDELPRYDEAFVTSTVRGLVPVQRIDRHKLHTARDSAVFQHILRLYGTWVETQLGHRVDYATGAVKGG